MPKGVYKHKLLAKETKIKIGISLKGRKGRVRTKEENLCLSKFLTGKTVEERGHKPGCKCYICKAKRGEQKGKIVAEISKERISKTHTGMTYNIEQCRVMGKANKGKRFTKEQNLSKGRKGADNYRFGKPCSRYIKRIYFEVPNQGRVCLRSSYEYIFATYLVAKQVDFRYEYKRFFLDAKSFLPDFYLVKENKFIEIKGWVRDADLQKMREMKVFHPDVEVEMIIGHEIDKYKLEDIKI
jgi:hypothetical protein